MKFVKEIVKMMECGYNEPHWEKMGLLEPVVRADAQPAGP